MNKNETNNEYNILKAAEAEFLEKGYSNTKTTSIARRAGVTHAMLHYYFRTKENLFQKVFQEKIQVIAHSLIPIYDKNLSFEETVRAVIESHFDFFARNPNLFFFVYSESKSDQSNRATLRSVLLPVLKEVLQRMKGLIKKEVEKGTIRPVEPKELLLNIVALNVASFVVPPFLREIPEDGAPIFSEEFLKERKESNVQFVLNALRK
jgi:Transcriptional regulator